MSCETGFHLPIRVAGLAEEGSVVDALYRVQKLRVAPEPRSWGCPVRKIEVKRDMSSEKEFNNNSLIGIEKL